MASGRWRDHEARQSPKVVAARPAEGRHSEGLKRSARAEGGAETFGIPTPDCGIRGLDELTVRPCARANLHSLRVSTCVARYAQALSEFLCSEARSREKPPGIRARGPRRTRPQAATPAADAARPPAMVADSATQPGQDRLVPLGLRRGAGSGSLDRHP